MSFELNEIEVRIIGCLVEKELTTPDYYPLTLNSLVNACNQKSNRFPVVNYTPEEVAQALARLNDQRLVYLFYGSTSRVTKYIHKLPGVYKLDEPETAVVSVLMLRGAQTLGELNQRTTRLYDFADLDEIERTLETLTQREEPVVLKLPVQPGRKEARYAHLLSGEIDLASLELPGSQTAGKNGRIENLEEKMGELKDEMSRFRQAFEDFKREFE